MGITVIDVYDYIVSYVKTPSEFQWKSTSSANTKSTSEKKKELQMKFISWKTGNFFPKANTKSFNSVLSV